MSGGWLARRPCFWAALIAAAAIGLTDQFSLPALIWVGLAAAGCLALPTRLRILGVIATVAAPFGALCAAVQRPAGAPQFTDGAPIALRGVVANLLPAAGERQRVVFAARERRVVDQWVPDHSRYGVVLNVPMAEGELAEISGRIEIPLPASNPAGYDARHAWLQRGVRYVVQLRPAGYRLIGKVPQSNWQHLAESLRGRILELNRRTLSPEAAYIANSFLVGDRATPDPDLAQEVQDTFRESGTLHLLVVSGTQVSLVLWAFLWLGGRWWQARYVVWALGLGALAFFHAITSGDASISRAALGGCLMVGALVCLRRLDGENGLGAAALVLLALNPFTLWDIGAQLSFAAVWSLFRVAPALEAALVPSTPNPWQAPEGVLRSLRVGGARLLASCIAAHLATAPLLAYHFQTASWSAVLANICIALLATAFMFVALAHVGLASLGMLWLTGVTEANARALYGWAKLFAAPPLGVVSVYPPPLWLLPLCFGLLVIASLRAKERGWVVGTLVTLTAMLVVSERMPAPPPSSPTVRAVDIGQGDAVLLQGIDGSNVLVDTGPPASGIGLVRTLRALRVGSLDALLVSHAHLDHIGGFPALAESLPPKLLLYQQGIADSEGWRGVHAIAAHAGIRLVPASAGDRIRIRQTTLSMLGPLPGTERDSENEESLVARWESGGARVLLTGDIGTGSEQSLLAWGTDLNADLLKIGHHGSNGSTSLELLAAVHPRLAVLSCGRHNRFGHPGEGALERLRLSGVPVFRTDQSGMVTIRLQPSNPVVETFLPVATPAERKLAVGPR